MKKRLISLLIAAVMLISCIPVGTLIAFAADPDSPKISVVEQYAAPDSTVQVELKITGNLGIAGAIIKVAFDSKLTLTDAISNGVFSSLDFTKPGSFTNPCNFTWDSENAEATEDGTFLTLTFHTSAEAQPNDKLSVSVSYRDGDIYDSALNTINLITEDGFVGIITYLPGDVNGDKSINGKDVTLLRRFMAGGYGVEINEDAADVNDDDSINGKDTTLIRRWIAGGYDVELKPHTPRCNHDMTATEAVAATCTEDGNIAYWHCTKCGKYYSDEIGHYEISFEDTVIAAKGHTVIIDPAVPATYTEKGLTEGSHCSVCHIVLQPQEEYGPLCQDQYSIEYYISGNDEYLAGIDIQNGNPSSYTSDEGVEWLEDLFVPGYVFEGWFDGQGSATSRVTSIPAGTARNLKLYAKWTKEEYTITFDNSSMNMPRSTMTYTVNQKVTLERPVIDRYVFLGWTTDSDELVSEIKPGTTGNFTLHSNWTSKRNLAKPVDTLDDPIIVEDTTNGRILFTYEIGQVENVPLYTLKDLPSAGGVVSVYSKEVTKKIEKTDATTVAKAIDHITTDSTAWTLSEDWNETTHIEDSILEEHGYDRTTGQQRGKTTSNTYTLTTNEYDNTVVKANGGSVATTTQYNTKDVNTRETWESKASLSVSDTESTKYTTSANVSAEIGAGYGPVSAKVGASMGTSTEISSSTTAGAAAETTIAHENTSHSKTGTDKVVVEDHTTATTRDKGWSKSSESSSSVSTSLTTYEEETLSEKIATEKHYGESYAKGGSNSSSAQSSTATGESNQYATTLTYFDSEETTEGVSYEFNGEADGSYRLVRAGIVHVFGVVIYDIAYAQYSVATFAVLDDVTYPYIDYSATSAPKFDDNENGVLPFEIPYYVNDYVNGRIVATEGLECTESTLSTGEYTGSNTSVIVPEFFSLDNQDETHSAYTVRNLSAGTFSGKDNIKSVLLSSYIREIPDSAFAGCTSLQFVYGSEITSIGNQAFAGCTSLGQFKVSSTVESIGEQAFQGVDSIVVTASNKDVVLNAINSGAKRITINIAAIADKMNDVTLTIPDTVEYFELQGGRNAFNGLQIKSDAETTVLNGMTITANSGTPLDISSEHITLNQVIVNAPSFVLKLRGNAPTVSLYGTSKLISSAAHAVVCRNTTFESINSNVTSKLEITGNLLSCGTPVNAESLTRFTDRGSVVLLTAAEYEKYIEGRFSVLLNANGGMLDEISMTAYMGAKIGALPEPTRQYYEFVGWYTEAEGGERVTSDSILDTIEDVTLYAHWSLQSFVITFDANGGSVVTTSLRASCNEPIGTLPTPTRDHYAFGGWYTEAEGGSEVTESSQFTTPNDFTLYAHWIVNQYTYTIVYQSSNGTDLGSSSETRAFGTTESVSAPAKSGYKTPDAQRVAWDQASKTITFIYTPNAASAVTKTGEWIKANSSTYMEGYTAKFECTSRTATSATIKITWTDTIYGGHGYYDQYGYQFKAKCGSVDTGKVTVVSPGTWSSSSSSARSKTATKSITVPITTTNATTVSLVCEQYQVNANYTVLGTEKDKPGTVKVNIPAY